MVIVLIQYEKNAFLRFLSFYVISSIFLLSVIAFLVFSIQKKQIYENIHNHMLLKSSQIAQTIIFLQMSEGYTQLQSNQLSKFEEKQSSFALFDSKKNRLYGSLNFIETSKNFFIKDKIAYLLNQGAFGHLGVEWILIKTDFSDQINALLKAIALVALFCLVFLMVFGFILGRMFLKPIRDGVSFLDCFLKDITHELNTPMSALMMSVNSLKSGVNDIKIGRIQKACKRIHFLYSNIAFLFLGEIREIKEDIHFIELLKNRIEMFEEHCREKHLKLELICKEKEFSIHADKEALIRMIDNLLSNAVKYNVQDGIIRVFISKQKLKVQNSGTPIPNELISYIKQRYVRGDTHSLGYGIGLDIISKVSKTYQWDFKISTQDNLNTFEIIF